MFCTGGPASDSARCFLTQEPVNSAFMPAPSPELPTLGKYRILIVEDDPAQRELLLLHLQSWGLNVVGAGDGREALSFLGSDDSIKLLITDLKMPVIDGLELLRRIQKSSRAKLYSIVLSGVSDRGTLINTLDAGATDYMVKPCHPKQLFARLAVLDKVMALEEGHRALVKDLFDVMGEMLGSRDNYTLVHCVRVAAISKRIAGIMGLSRDEIEALEIGCLVHDIGKIAIPDDILLKPDRFDKRDRRIMNMHPVIGAGFLASRYPDDRVIKIILNHHERLDGSGYPQGLRARDIPTLVRIVAVADIYEALVAKRPYKQPFKKDRAMAILNEEAGQGRVDRDVVVALGRALRNWDPLSIKRPVTMDTTEIESFRRIAYFREPLCNFYNYRYLLARDRGFALQCGNAGYYLLLIDFVRLKEVNRDLGYLKTDQLLDEFGETIQVFLSEYNKKYACLPGESILCRKGADYLIYISYPDAMVGQIEKKIREILESFKKSWGLDAKLLLKSFACGFPLEDSLDQMFFTEA